MKLTPKAQAAIYRKRLANIDRDVEIYKQMPKKYNFGLTEKYGLSRQRLSAIKKKVKTLIKENQLDIDLY